MNKQQRFMLKAATAVVAGGLALAGCTTTTNNGSPTAQSPGSTSSKRQEINSGVDAALSRMYAQVPGSRDLVSRARGVLVFPKVLQAGFVVGGEFGEGALRTGGTTQGYYNLVSGSFGLQAGAQSKTVVFLFMTDDALKAFQQRQGWSVGGDASVALLKMGANGAVDTTTATKPVQVIVMTNAGLMGDLSLQGMKISRINL
ncbi:MAG: BPSL1445 family SYLF domain-containing lipoprotein [Trinickia sp.]|jgi:lipid-binding SYLF domain-containing protein|uniref:BPSL1445 family SYLF domain-containing lipoprotein n=1 Tax=Trinickia sp. TaxID=2571163 RepID=UPI002BB42335|nr:YSC84-related protein [Paraburkholderia sp.]